MKVLGDHAQGSTETDVVVAVHVELDSLSVVRDGLGSEVAAAVAHGVGGRLVDDAPTDIELVAGDEDEFTVVLSRVGVGRAHERARDLLLLTREALRLRLDGSDAAWASVRARCGAAIGPGPVERVVADARQAAANDRPSPSPRHEVLFHASDDAFIARLERFVSDGVAAGETVALAATAEHLRALDRRGRGHLDMTALVASGRLLLWEAESLLASLRPFGTVNTGRFEAVVEPMVRGIVRHGRARVYGELVALLFAEGDVLGACTLEESWNRLLDRHDFSLLCGYPSSVLDEDRAAGAVCSHHGSVHQPVS